MQRLFYGGTNMYLGVDLGSTNIKAAIYDGSMQLVGQQSRPVEYLRENGFVEFDAERYYNELAALIAQLTRDCGISKIRQIAFTGQAESLVCVDAEGHACMHAISWMDERSTEECKLLAAQFDAALCERVTGQQALLPTWPATKILWLKKNRPDVFAATETFMLLKELGRYGKPVLLKRGMSATIDELLMSAEYIMSEGNDQVMLCERGIRTFETRTRNTFDVSAIPVLRELTHLPIIADPSHATGYTRFVTPVACAATAAQADGLEVEVHHDPAHAASDGAQALLPEQFEDMMRRVGIIRSAVTAEW